MNQINKFKIIGKVTERIKEIAQEMLVKKHHVNSAYKFNDKIKHNENI